MNVSTSNKPIIRMHVAAITTICLLLGCGTPQNKSKNVIGPSVEEDTSVINIPKDEIPVIEAPKIPKGAVIANFRADDIPFYAVVDNVDKKRGVTSIRFEQPGVPPIVLTETYGATLTTLRFDEFDRDLLLVESKLKDPVFTKYYLYVLRNNQWKLVVNGFSIHQDNQQEHLDPIVVNPENSDQMKRYYSVFDLDKKSPKGYTWRLLEEVVPILNK